MRKISLAAVNCSNNSSRSRRNDGLFSACCSCDFFTAARRGFAFVFREPFLVVAAMEKTAVEIADFYVRQFEASSK
jgi:hypothetical protein